MQITTQPDPISLVGNIKHIVVATETDVKFRLFVKNQNSGWDNVVQHTYSPDADGRVEIDVKTIVIPMLSFTLQDISTPYRQDNIVREFKADVTELTAEGEGENINCTFQALRAGIDCFDGDVDSFLMQNFLTWQPNLKPVTYYTPEFLTYFAIQPVTARCRIYVNSNDYEDFSLVSIPAGECWTIPVQYAVIAALLNNGDMPLYYDVWCENLQGERLTYIQRYYPESMRSEQEEWILFENSLGGIDTFRAYGDSENNAEHTHNVAEINENLEEYRVDTTRNHKKNTGYLGKRERRWLLDFFPSLGKFVYAGNFLRRIVVTESDVNYKEKELPSSYSFTYRYSDQRPYLNIPRADVPQTMLDISVPDAGSFTVAPRLVEFPRLSLSSGALIPVQSPYSESWAVTTVAALLEFIANSLRESYAGGGGLGHLHTNIALLNALSLADGYLMVNAAKIKAAYADKARDIDLDSPANNRFLSRLQDDIAQGLITLRKGLLLGDGDAGITADGDATLESLRTKSYSGPDLVTDKGLKIWEDTDGKSHIVTDFFSARVKAFFSVLEYKKTEHSAGNETKSPAGGTIALVRKYDGQGNELREHFVAHTFFGRLIHMMGGFFGHRYVPASEEIAYYRCYFAAEDDEKGVTNDWRVGDQAYCETYNLRAHDSGGVAYGVTNKRYWRLVLATGYEVIDGKEYAFIDLANELACQIVVDGVTHDCVGYEDINDIGVPEAGDDVAAFGSQIYPGTRGGAVQIITCGENDGGRLPAIRIYAGINDFDLTGHLVKESSPAREMVRADKFEIISASGTGNSGITCQRGEWYTGAVSGHFDVWQHHGSSWLCIVPKGETTTTEPSDTRPTLWVKYAARGHAAPNISLGTANAVVSASYEGKISGLSNVTGLPSTIELYVDGNQVPVADWNLAGSYVRYYNRNQNLANTQAHLATGINIDYFTPGTDSVAINWSYDPDIEMGHDGIRRYVHPVISPTDIALHIVFDYNGETLTADAAIPMIVQKAAPSVIAQYSADGTTWGYSFYESLGHIYVRISYDGGVTWTPKIRIVGKSIEFDRAITKFSTYSDMELGATVSGVYICDTDANGNPKATAWIYDSSNPIFAPITITDKVNYLTSSEGDFASTDGHLWNADGSSDHWNDMGVIQGADGADGISIVLDPATVIFEQEENDVDSLDSLSFFSTVHVWQGTRLLNPRSDYSVNLVQDQTDFHCNANVGNYNEVHITGVSKRPGTDVYYSSGKVGVVVTIGNVDTTLVLNWAANLLGTWKLNVRRDVMEMLSEQTVSIEKANGTTEEINWKSIIQQVHNDIGLSVRKNELEQVGVHLDGENSTLDLRANKTLFSRPDGTPFIKVGADNDGIGYLIFMMPDGETPAYNLGYTGLPQIINESQQASFSNPLKMAKLSAPYSDCVEDGIPCSTLYRLCMDESLPCYYRYNQSRIKQGNDWILVPLTPNHDGKYYNGNTLDTANQSLPAGNLTELDNILPATPAADISLWVGEYSRLTGWDDSQSHEQYVRYPMIKLSAALTLYWVRNSRIIHSEQIVVTREKAGRNTQDVYYVTDTDGITAETYFPEYENTNLNN